LRLKEEKNRKRRGKKCVIFVYFLFSLFHAASNFTSRKSNTDCLIVFIYLQTNMVCVLVCACAGVLYTLMVCLLMRVYNCIDSNFCPAHVVLFYDVNIKRFVYRNNKYIVHMFICMCVCGGRERPYQCVYFV
jgi:hypothetical protein